MGYFVTKKKENRIELIEKAIKSVKIEKMYQMWQKLPFVTIPLFILMCDIQKIVLSAKKWLLLNMIKNTMKAGRSCPVYLGGCPLQLLQQLM